MCHVSICVKSLVGNALSWKGTFSVGAVCHASAVTVMVYRKGFKVTSKVKFCIKQMLNCGDYDDTYCHHGLFSSTSTTEL
jgi:translation initiation factor 2B subunit (eIF-2B alpha/beta/delta family)